MSEPAGQYTERQSSRLIVLALFHITAGVRTANRMPPIVEWSSARIDDVYASPLTST